MNIEINPGKVLTLLLCIVAFLLFANIMGIVSRIFFDHDHVYGLVDLFDFDNENNIPTLYSSILLVISSMILLYVSQMHRKLHEPYLLWVVLSFVFLFLSVDEASSIHEKLSSPTRVLLDTSGFFYYAWIIPYGIAVIIFVALYLNFLLKLPKYIMMSFLLSGGIYVLGAVGFEMLGGWQDELYGDKGLLYSIFYTCEEFLEMLGVAVFIYALLKYILNQKQFIKITLIEFNRAI